MLKLWSYDESKIRREGWKTISEDTYVTFKGAALDECIENNKKGDHTSVATADNGERC